MSIRRAAGNGQVAFNADLGNLATETFTSIQQALESWKAEQKYDGAFPKLPPEEPILYTYWYGNARNACYPDGRDPLVEGGWVDPTH
jgi:hypothetical protein